MSAADDPQPPDQSATPGPAARPKLLGPLIIIGLALLAGAGALFALNSGASRSPAPPADGLRGGGLPPSLDRRPAFAFELADARGGQIAAADLLGRPYALTFLYTRCTDVCPLIGQELKQALEGLGPAASRTAVVGVSVDPRGDTPPAARDWLARRRMPDNFHYAIGDKGELEPVWSAYFAAPQIPGRPETSTHTASIWLIDARGRLRTKYSAGAPVRPRDITRDLQTLIAEADTSAAKEKTR